MWIAAVMCVVLVSLLGCKPGATPSGPDPLPPRPTLGREPVADVNPDLVSANTSFGFKLFHELIGDEPSENVFISPSSIAFALAMAYNGADADTRNAMAEVLGLAEMAVEEANQANADLMAALRQAEPAVALSIANSLWARQEVEFLPDFLGTNEEFYGAKVTALDFTDPKTPDTINAWVKDETRGKIAEIVPRNLSPQAIMFLINAIYFKGRWDEEFDKQNTSDESFTLLDGSEKTVPMMYQFGEYAYLDGEGFQAISLPYVGKRVSMVIFLPDEDSSLAQFCADLDADTWESRVGGLHHQEGSIKLPRFTLEYGAKLKESLTALGMGVAFDPQAANFRNMCTSLDAVWIGEVRHKTFVEVNEEGTEAAAVTSVEMEGETAAPMEQPFEMVVDRPFFCAIRDNETGTLLFMGTIVDPEQA